MVDRCDPLSNPYCPLSKEHVAIASLPGSHHSEGPTFECVNPSACKLVFFFFFFLKIYFLFNDCIGMSKLNYFRCMIMNLFFRYYSSTGDRNYLLRSFKSRPAGDR